MKTRFLILLVISLVSRIASFGQTKNNEQLSLFSPKEFSLAGLGLQDYPYKNTITQLLESPIPANWTETRVDKSGYLEMMEKIVRKASAWVDKNGAVIDPYYKAEFGQTTPRFVSSASILLHFGRIKDLKPLVLLAMTYSCNQLTNRKADSPDFWMRELSTAFKCLQPLVPQATWLSWKNLLIQVDPEKTYKEVDQSGKNLNKLNNWTVYASGGEYVRQAFGLTSASNTFLYGINFFERYMRPQLVHFTEKGMYRDPNDPITYDITTRLQIANALAYGYDGNLKNQLSELLRRGGLTMLLFTSPDGLAPYGGRSSQFEFQEAIIAALSELEARRYKETDKKLAGAFKRQAHKSLLSMRRWIMEMEPLRHIKNGFPPETQHGIDEYGKYSVYALYCSSVLGLAALYADDDIKEYPCPCESGGFLVEISPAFHKIFATTKDSHIEIDTRGDLNYDATGLGRFQVKDVPLELGLSMPFATHPKYRLADSLKPIANCAIGPAWKMNHSMSSLADLSVDLTHKLIPEQVNKDTVSFEIEYLSKTLKDVIIQQQYKLFSHTLFITSRVKSSLQNIDSIYFIVPLLVTNGQSVSKLLESNDQVTVQYLGHFYKIELDKESAYNIDKKLFANRNGIYQNLIISKPGNSITVHLRLE